MNYGRFFEFDLESSYMQKGIAVFNYRRLQQKQSGKRTSPRYPVYLVFTPESILFNLHYYEDENSKVQKHSLRSHYHNTIIELRLSPNIDVMDGLTESLNNTFDAQFPVKDNKPLLKAIRDSFDFPDCKMSGYYCLETFKPESKEAYEGSKETHFLRKLILDFLYDLDFTDVFKNVAFYDEISTKLKENFLFSALANKVRYYYYRTVICADEVAGCKIENIEEWNAKMKFFFEQYASAEHEWVSSIIDDRAMTVFHESPWFGEAYQELDQVYVSHRSESWRKQNGKVPEISKISEIPNVPLVSYIGELKAKQAYMKRIGVTEADSFGLTVSNLLNLIRKKTHKLVDDEKTHKKTVDDEKTPQNAYNKAIRAHCETVEAAAVWNVSHYHFFNLWKLWFGDKKTLFWSMSVVVLMMGLVGVLCYNKMYFLNENELWKNWGFVVTLIIIILLLVVMGRIMRNRFRSTWGRGGVAMIMPRLLAAIVAAWFTMSMSDDLFRYFAEEEYIHGSAVIILSLIIVLFVWYESRSLNPYDKWYHCAFSSLIVFLIAYIYSFIVGLLVYDFFGETMMDQIYKENGLQVFNVLFKDEPEIIPVKKIIVFVAQFSFFASFIGIFLQLMFKGRSITEMRQ